MSQFKSVRIDAVRRAPPKIDWSRADAMTTEQRRATAMGDPDNRPMTDEEWSAAPRVSQIRVIRRALKLPLRVGSPGERWT